MQLYARDSQQTLIFAGQASKHTDYTCIECSQTVRLRSGIHRQHHFYHLHPNESCKQHGKSMIHLMLQCHLQKILPPEEAHLECRFPSIGRIADVAWHVQKLIFEIQCSPISAEEVSARNSDYASLGFEVVWILHDRRFNRWRLSAAEHVLNERIHFFTDMDSTGKGMIYEQLCIVHNGIRKERAAKQPVKLSAVQQTILSSNQHRHTLPKIALKKMRASPLNFDGDTVYQCMEYLNDTTHQPEHIQNLAEMEMRWADATSPQSLGSMYLGTFLKLAWKRLIAAPYGALLRLLLERACR